MKYEFGTASCAVRWIERTTGVARFRGKTGKGEISTAPSHAILAHPGKPISPDTGDAGAAGPVSAISLQPDLPSSKTSASVPTRVEFPTEARSRVRARHRMRAAVENSCTAVHHLTKALFLSKPAEPLLITVSLRGGEIGAGTGPLDLILEKATGFRSLLYRMAEWVGRYPLRHHGPPPKDLQGLVQARATEPAVGSYKLEIRLTEPVQPHLFEPPRVQPAELSDRLFNFLECLTAGTSKDLEDLVPQSDYRKALLQLTRNIVPGGKRLREVGIYRTKNDRLQSVFLTDALPPRIREVMPKQESPSEERMSYRGTLRALHLDRNWLELALEDGSHITCDTVPDMLDDVVGPMVNRHVLVTGPLRQKRGKSRLLASEIDLVDEE